ncbi:Gfo/Idh/MocA family oxidoreductase [Saccharomonospora sp. NPDC046836]|uniref:Gfo/Idh/MocA family protein n=1 Tax=Saccharomonospora sp. NPDC046836 TaxID=3156921 RepID=UPI003409C923
MMNAAVIGLGWWGRKVVGDLRDSPHIRVCLGVDPSPDGRAAADALGVAAATDFEHALADEKVDAVILCTPHKFHADQIVAAAQAGKNVFCEKPLTTTGAHARKAIDAVTSAGVQLGIGHEKRFEPAVVALLSRCAAGEFGTPLVFEGNFSQDKFLDLPADNWRLSDTEAPVGPLSATGIHLVDLAIALFGRPVSVWARLATLATGFANGDTLTITLAFPRGETALITAVLTTPFAGRIALLGSRGWVEIRDRNHPEQPQGWDVTTVHRGAEPVTTFQPPHPSVRENIEQFARAAAGELTYPVTLDEMLANVETFEAITRSARSGQVERVG